MENKPVSGWTLGRVLCEMFNIDPKYVVGISVEANLHEIATVTVTTIPIISDGWKMSQTFNLVNEVDCD